MTKQQLLDHGAKLTSVHADKYCDKRNEHWWMRASDHEQGFTAAVELLWPMVEVLENQANIFNKLIAESNDRADKLAEALEKLANENLHGYANVSNFARQALEEYKENK